MLQLLHQYLVLLLFTPSSLGPNQSCFICSLVGKHRYISCAVYPSWSLSQNGVHYWLLLCRYSACTHLVTILRHVFADFYIDLFLFWFWFWFRQYRSVLLTRCAYLLCGEAVWVGCDDDVHKKYPRFVCTVRHSRAYAGSASCYSYDSSVSECGII